MSTAENEKLLKVLQPILSGYQPISLHEMEEVELMSRFDSKYIFNASALPGFLRALHGDYQVLKVDQLTVFKYENLYYDTAALRSYLDHHNGRSGRYKVRFRNYADSENIYLEVKQKTNKGLTEKARMPVEAFSDQLLPEQIAFVKAQLGNDDNPLVPQISNNFSRITLVNKNTRERVTIDLFIYFKKDQLEHFLDELVIAEVKEFHPSSISVFKKLMLANRIFPTSFSKYCMGTLLTHPGIKYNRFKPKLIKLKKICNVAD